MTGVRMAFAVELSPVSSVPREVSGMLGEALHTLIAATHSEAFATKADVAVSELVTNVLEHAGEHPGAVRCELSVDATSLRVCVRGGASEAQCAEVLRRVEALNAASDAKALLKATLKERHAERLKGGVGLLRLRAENGFRVHAERVQHELAITAEYSEYSELSKGGAP